MDYETMLEALLVSDNFRVGLWDFLLAIGIPFLLCLIIALVYTTTQSYRKKSAVWLRSLFLSSMSAGFLMVVLGGEIPRAIGILAIAMIFSRRLAFRTSQSAFTLWALVTGTACGFKYYFAATVCTFLISILMMLLYLFRKPSNLVETKSSP